MADIEFKDNSKEVLELMDSATSRALEAIGMTAEGYAKKETPVQTGRLRNSIAHAVKGDSAYIGSNVEYARYVEFGSRTVHRPAHMLQKAVTQHSEEYKRLAKEAMKNA